MTNLINERSAAHWRKAIFQDQRNIGEKFQLTDSGEEAIFWVEKSYLQGEEKFQLTDSGEEVSSGWREKLSASFVKVPPCAHLFNLVTSTATEEYIF